MPCNDRTTRCAPPSDCPPTPAPVLPRCDVVLPDGVFANATVVVEGGCIIAVTAGEPLVYDPDPCCSTPGGGGGGGDGLEGPPGPPGDPATVNIGSVSTLAPGSPATVTNVGTPTNAIFNFGIPAGVPGADGEGAGGVTDSSAGIEIEDGLVQALPVAWPPVLTAIGSADYPTVTVTADKNTNGQLSIQIEGLQAMYDALQLLVENTDQQIRNDFSAELDAINEQLQQITARLDDCCPPP